MCSTCKNLDDKNTKKGINGGTLYYCKKKHEYVYATGPRCGDYEKGKRDKDKSKKLISESEKYDDIPSGLAFPIFIVILMLIFYIISILTS